MYKFSLGSEDDTNTSLLAVESLTHSEDPSIEIFTTRAGSNGLRHVRTVADPVVLHSPNDVAGSPDGKEFWFTNDVKDVDGWKVRAFIYTHEKMFFAGEGG